MQQHVAGIDFLAPGFLIALAMRQKTEAAWLFLIFVLIQEGTGSLTFGTAMLWYGGQTLLFALSSHLFVLNNVLFISLMSLGLGVYRALLLLLMSALQDIPMNYNQIIFESIIQALVIPLVWWLAYLLMPRVLRNGR